MVWLDNERLHMSPVHKRMRMSVVRVEPGLAVLSMPLSEELRGYFDGSIHGGMLATFADAASASCLFPTPAPSSGEHSVSGPAGKLRPCRSDATPGPGSTG